VRKFFFILCLIIFSFGYLRAQVATIITVKAGTRVIDYFPPEIRYRYRGFTDGQLILRNGRANSGLFNYNFLLGEMEFIRSGDTLAIIDKKSIRLVTVDRDTFFYDNGYIELMYNGGIKTGMKQIFRIREIVRKGGFGETNRNSALETYNLIALYGNFYVIVPNEDWIFEKWTDFFISPPGKGFFPFTMKNVIKYFPLNKDQIKNYLKSNKVDFASGNDLVKFSWYLDHL